MPLDESGQTEKNLVRYRMTLVRAGRLMLDAGAMFGIIPRPLWRRTVDVDEQYRMVLCMNCLLLETVSSSGHDSQQRAPSSQKVLIETGAGNKFDNKMAEILGLDGRTAESELKSAGHDPDDINTVIATHLHFDHAGGLTRRCHEREHADWGLTDEVQVGNTAGVKFTFPNAQLVVQQREWSDAVMNRAVMTRSYRPDHILPFENERLLTLDDGRERLRRIESPLPFEAGYVPDRSEPPRTSMDQRMTEILPGIWVFLVPGHTWGQQAVLFHNESGCPIVFAGDIIPSAGHVGATFNPAYDIEPYTNTVTKSWLFREASERGWVLCLDHEPGNPFVSVRPNNRDWYDFELVAI